MRQRWRVTAAPAPQTAGEQGRSGSVEPGSAGGREERRGGSRGVDEGSGS